MSIGARFGEVWGFERALFFDRSELEEDYDVMAPPAKPTFGMPHWFDMVKEEYRNCRQGSSLCYPGFLFCLFLNDELLYSF